MAIFMFFNLCYKNDKSRKTVHRYMFMMGIIMDFGALFFINILLTVLGFGVEKIIRSIRPFEVNFYAFAAIVILIILAEVISVFVIETKRRKEYVRLDHRGIYIHTGAGENFGYFSINPAAILITFDKIKGFYCGVPYNMPKNFSYIYNNSFDIIIKTFGSMTGRRGTLNSQKLIPSIPDGRYEEECIMLELKNGYTAVLPIEKNEQFKKYLNEYMDKYQELNNSAF